MFEKTLADKLKRIFDLEKATYDFPSDSREQECIFIEVESSRNSIRDRRALARVTGKIRVFCNTEKLPYGYFSKRISFADKEDTKDLFFFDIEENAGTFRNISERSMSFVYLFNSQFHPNIGELTELETSIEES